MSYFFKPWPVLPFAVIRAGFGALFLWHYLQIAPDFVTLYSHLVSWQARQPDALYWMLLAACMVSSVLVMIGLWTRASLLALFFFHSIVLMCNPLATWGWAFIARHFLVALMLVPAGGMLSADVHWRGRPLVRFAPAWGARIFQWQISLIYLVCVVARWDLPEWRNGTFAGIAMMEENFARFPALNWSEWVHALKPLSYSAMVLESAGAILPLLGPLQPLAALGLIGLHLGMELLLRVQGWQYLMILCLLLYIPPRWWRRDEPPENFPVRRWIPAAILTWFALTLVAAWPTQKLPGDLRSLQAAAEAPLEFLTLNKTKYMIMFSGLSHRHRTLLNAFRREPDGSETLIYSTAADSGARWRMFPDDVALTLIKLTMGAIETDRVLGRYLCRLSGGAPGRWQVDYQFYWLDEEGGIQMMPQSYGREFACANPLSRRR